MEGEGERYVDDAAAKDVEGSGGDDMEISDFRSFVAEAQELLRLISELVAAPADSARLASRIEEIVHFFFRFGFFIFLYLFIQRVYLFAIPKPKINKIERNIEINLFLLF